MRYAFETIGVLFCCSQVLSSTESTSSMYKSIYDVPIFEEGEELVDLRDQAEISYNQECLVHNPLCTQMRKTVYEKLCQAQRCLPQEFRFQLLIGLRSLTVQQKIFEDFYRELEKKYPSKNQDELFDETCKFVAPVQTKEGLLNTPPHATGGAIDIVLITQEGERVDMGQDSENLLLEEIIQTDSPLISLKARLNRETMGNALRAVGFVNYPREYWHWSYGDRRWAFETGAGHSMYGPAEHCISRGKQ